MDSKVGYDFDGVLCAPAPVPEKPFFRMSGPERRARKELLLKWFAEAPPLLLPQFQAIHVLTARKLEVEEVSRLWLKEHLPSFSIEVHFFSGQRTYDNVAVFKVGKIIELGLKRYTEDNEEILRRLSRKLPESVQLYHFNGKEEIPYVARRRLRGGS